MKKTIRATGKTVEEALLNAALELGEKPETLVYEVVCDAKRGFLGIGASDAEIEVTVMSQSERSVRELMDGLIANMGLDLKVEYTDIESTEREVELLVSVSGEGSGMLIGHHGETLDSLQYLLNLSANRKENGQKRPYARITLDIEGYREKRAETLRTLARRQAEKVLKYKISVMLEPMNPYERRIIHSTIQEIEGVSTNSIGSESNRKVVIYLDNDGKKN